MSHRSALDLYIHFVSVIDAAASERNIFAIERAAVDAGIPGVAQPRGLGRRWDYHYVDEQGNALILHARYWDQSKAFSNLPDMHVMSAVLVEKGTPRHHEKRYEE